jgi:hypothetical protein
MHRNNKAGKQMMQQVRKQPPSQENAKRGAASFESFAILPYLSRILPPFQAMHKYRARRRSGGSVLLLTLGILLICPLAVWSRKVRLTWVNGKLAECSRH